MNADAACSLGRIHRLLLLTTFFLEARATAVADVFGDLPEDTLTVLEDTAW